MEQHFPKGEYALFGSTPLAAHGIRESKDIDLVVTPKLYKELLKRGWKEEFYKDKTGKRLVYGVFEADASWNYGKAYNLLPNELIAKAEIIDRIPFVSLDEVLKWKEAFGRDKDMADVKLIKQYLGSPQNKKGISGSSN